MKVYQVEGDGHYMGIVYQGLEELRLIGDVEFNNTVLDPRLMVKVRYAFDEPEDEGVITDCPNSGVGTTLVVSERAIALLGPLLTEAGVLIGLDPGHDMGYKMFVCYRHVDALDTDRTIHDEGLPGFITKYEFKAVALEGVDLFRLSNRKGRLYASERFRQEVIRHRLTGFRFQLLWSSEEGGVTFDDAMVMFPYLPGRDFATALREKRQAMRDLIAIRGPMFGALPDGSAMPNSSADHP